MAACVSVPRSSCSGEPWRCMHLVLASDQTWSRYVEMMWRCVIGDTAQPMTMHAAVHLPHRVFVALL